MLNVVSAVSVEGAEVENTTTESAMASTTFPAGFWQPGKRVRVHGACIVNDNNGTNTVTPRLRFGVSTTPASNDSVAAGAAVDVADGDAGVVMGELICRDVGDGTYKLIGSGILSDVDAPGSKLGGVFFDEGTAFDPKVATYLDYTAEWSVAHADNEIAAATWAVDEITG